MKHGCVSGLGCGCGCRCGTRYGDWLNAVGGRLRSPPRTEGETMIDSQNRAVQRATVSRSKLAAQNNSRFCGMFPVFSENIPI